jgi:hypothetical protein
VGPLARCDHRGCEKSRSGECLFTEEARRLEALNRRGSSINWAVASRLVENPYVGEAAEWIAVKLDLPLSGLRARVSGDQPWSLDEILRISGLLREKPQHFLKVILSDAEQMERELERARTQGGQPEAWRQAYKGVWERS